MRREEQRRDDARDAIVVTAVTEAVPAADVVVIVEHQQRLRAVQLGFRFHETLTEKRGIELVAESHQRIHRQLQLVALRAPVPRVEVGGIRHVGLADQQPSAAVAVDHGTHAADDVVHLREIVGVGVLEVGIALGVGAAERRLIAQLRILEQRRDRIEAESGDAAIQPEAHGAEHRLLDLRIAPVEIRLLAVELVVVELVDRRHVLPGRAAEEAHPVVGRQRLGARAALAVVPDIEVVTRRGARAGRFHEPGMAVGGVVEHHVEEHPDVVCSRLLEQAVEVRERPVLRVDVLVVGDVIAEVDLGRGVHGRDPDRIDAEGLEVIEPLRDAVEIADPVAVGILEAARIDLVDHRVLPPGVGVGRSGCPRRRRAARFVSPRDAPGGEQTRAEA